MKKTIIALLALGGVVTADETVTYTITTGIKDGDNVGNGYTALTLSLTDVLFNTANNVLTTASDGSTQFNATTVDLNSISFLMRNETDTYDDITLTVKNSENDVVAVSSASIVTEKYKQEDVFNSGYYYTQRALQFTFASEDDQALTIGDTYTLTFSAGVNLRLTSNKSSGITLNATPAYMPANMVITATSVTVPKVTPSSPAVPEPTTATLSLLALVGLAARRRRK